MGISEREYQEMLKRNEQLRVHDDGRPSQPHAAAYRLTEVKLHAAPAPTEHEEQCALFAWAAATRPILTQAPALDGMDLPYDGSATRVAGRSGPGVQARRARATSPPSAYGPSCRNT